MAGGRRARHGEPDRAGDLPALRLAHVAARRDRLRALAGALEHDAAVAFRRALPAQAQADLRHPGHGARLQQRDASTRAPSPRQQGTQFDALGHFGVRGQPWDGKAPLDEEKITYYGGFTQKDVKPTPDSPLLKLGMDKVPPIVTSAVLLDAKAFVGGGKPMNAGRAGHREAHRGHAEGAGPRAPRHPAGRRGVRAYRLGRATGATRTPTRSTTPRRPGLSYDAARYLGEQAHRRHRPGHAVHRRRCPRACSPARAGRRKARRPACPSRCTTTCSRRWASTISRTPSSTRMARDKVWLSCTMVLPLLEKGAAGSAVRPVAIGAPAMPAGRK